MRHFGSPGFERFFNDWTPVAAERGRPARCRMVFGADGENERPKGAVECGDLAPRQSRGFPQGRSGNRIGKRPVFLDFPLVQGFAIETLTRSSDLVIMTL